MRNDAELIWKVFLPHRLLHGVVGQGAVVTDRFKDEPTLEKTVGVRRLVRGARPPGGRRRRAGNVLGRPGRRRYKGDANGGQGQGSTHVVLRRWFGKAEHIRAP